MTIQELAKLMSAQESDVEAFVACLRVWIDKGYSLEDAINRHMQVMSRLAERSSDLPKEVAISLYDDLRAA